MFESFHGIYLLKGSNTLKNVIVAAYNEGVHIGRQCYHGEEATHREEGCVDTTVAMVNRPHTQ